jgi:hypothetical protein
MCVSGSGECLPAEWEQKRLERDSDRSRTTNADRSRDGDRRGEDGRTEGELKPSSRHADNQMVHEVEQKQKEDTDQAAAAAKQVAELQAQVEALKTEMCEAQKRLAQRAAAASGQVRRKRSRERDWEREEERRRESEPPASEGAQARRCIDHASADDSIDAQRSVEGRRSQPLRVRSRSREKEREGEKEGGGARSRSRERGGVREREGLGARTGHQPRRSGHARASRSCSREPEGSTRSWSRGRDRLGTNDAHILAGMRGVGVGRQELRGGSLGRESPGRSRRKWSREHALRRLSRSRSRYRWELRDGGESFYASSTSATHTMCNTTHTPTSSAPA